MDPKETPKDDPKDGGKFKPPASQEELDRIITQRIERERAKFADYDELKAKAAKFDEAAEANKSEQQKLEDRVTKAEEAAAKAQLEALRFRVATKHGISDEDAELFLTGTDEKALTAQAERLAERADAKRKMNPSPGEGGTTTPADDPKRQFLTELRGGG